MDDFEQKISLITSTTDTIFTNIFGKFWFLFVFLFFLNILDYITGTVKARYLKTESADKSFKGFIKTFYMWIVIIISFGIGFMFVELGERFEVNLSIMMGIGWFMLAHCIINEIRSILENIVQMDKGDIIPDWLIKGLEVTQNLVDKKASSLFEKLETTTEDTSSDSTEATTEDTSSDSTETTTENTSSDSTETTTENTSSDSFQTTT